MALHQRGHVDSFLGNYDAARSDYQAAVDLSDPEDVVEFAIGRALVSVWEGNPQRAISELEELVVALGTMDIAEPGSAQIWVLSTIVSIAAHFRLQDSARKAIEMSASIMMQQAEQIGSEAFRRGSLAELAYYEGMIAARMGNFEEAIEHYQEIRADYVYALYHLALAHEGAGHADVAQAMFKEAASYNFNDMGFCLIRDDALSKAAEDKD